MPGVNSVRKLEEKVDCVCVHVYCVCVCMCTSDANQNAPVEGFRLCKIFKIAEKIMCVQRAPMC